MSQEMHPGELYFRDHRPRFAVEAADVNRWLFRITPDLRLEFAEGVTPEDAAAAIAEAFAELIEARLRALAAPPRG